MVKGEAFMDVRMMHRHGASIREIAHRTGLSQVTVRRIQARVVPKACGPRKPRPSKLAPFLGHLETALAARPFVRATVLFEEIAAQGYPGRYEAVKRWVRGLLESDSTRPVFFFRFVLAWSRMRWTLVVPSLSLGPTLAALRWALEQARGVPQRLVHDYVAGHIIVPYHLRYAA